jgi:hypothetical protein
MKIQSCIATTMLLALAGCGGSGTDGNGSTAASSGGGESLQPGEWELKSEVLSVNAPGLPPAVAAQMKQPATVKRECITPEEAKAPKSGMFAGEDAKNCKQEGFNWSGGRIAGTTTCTSPDGSPASKVTMTMAGQYSAQSMDINIKTNTETQGVKMDMEMRMSGRRIGECPAGKA